MTPGASVGGSPSVPLPIPAWVPVATWLCLISLVALLIGMGYRRWRRNHRPKMSDRERALQRWVAWVASRWPWEAQNLGLVLIDETTRHRHPWWSNHVLPPVVCYPKATFYPAANGLRAYVQTLPGVGLDQVAKMAGHLANAWGCIRVEVRQDRPGLLYLRGLLTDPLAATWLVRPDGRPLTDWLLHVGVDDEGETVLLPLANLSGVTVAGVPGTGKTSLQRWWLCQLAPHPAVQIAVLDGKVSDAADGDYGELAPRCFAMAGDDPAQANGILQHLWETMRCRSAWLRANRGSSQFWDAGPSGDCPLVVVIVDESHTYATAATKAQREACESNIWYLTKLAKEGRSRGFVTVFVTQKQTADAIPTAIRDVCQVGLAFGVRTMDGAVAALGDDIRQYPEIAPTELIGRQWTGVAVMRRPDCAGFHRVRTPYVSDADAALIAAQYAAFTRDPGSIASLLPLEGPAR